MIPLKKLSASSITTFDSCEMKWFIQYILNYREPSGKPAVIGTICHYVLECIAQSKIVRQTGTPFNDEIVGKIGAEYDLAKWIDVIYDYHVNMESHLVWTDEDYKDVQSNLKKAAKHHLYPENHPQIIEPEGGFFIPIGRKWANYSYLEEEEVKSGQILLNGYIDLVFRDNQGMLNFVDYKFGKSATDWATGKPKTFSSFVHDTQCCMYYLALKEKFPNEDIVANLWYVRAGKTFTHIFGREQEVHLFAKLESTISKIKGMRQPDTKYSFSCNFCPFKKTNFADWGMPSLDMEHGKVPSAHFDAVGGKTCVCDSMKVFLNYRGLEATMQNGRKHD